MASVMGVSSLLRNFSSASLDFSRRATRTAPVASRGIEPCFCFIRSARGQRLVVRSAIATPNSVLSEEALKRLGKFKDRSPLDEEEEYEPGGRFEKVDSEELDVSKLGLPEQLVNILQKRGITNLFPIQRAVLIPALEGRDIIARAKTGTGKTLAFGIPLITKLSEAGEGQRRRAGRLPRVLVLAPTRELAKQVEKEIKETAPYLNTVCVYGGVSYNVQQNALARGVDVVVGTPGRIIDLINGESLQLGEVQYLILDEADQMLAVGFEEDVEVILEKLPPKRQSMLFSATMPGWVKNLSRKYLDNPLTIDLVGDEEEKLAEGIKLYALCITASSKRTILSDLITVYAKGGKTIVFTQTKKDADEMLQLVGLDIPNVDLIVHYEIPNDPETFVHRSGRTGRAGKEGSAILMFTSSQRRTVKSLERDVGCRFDFISPPQINEVLESSSEQVLATLQGVHSESIQYFLPTAQKLIEEKGVESLAAALAHLSGFSQPPSSRSLISHEQGWVTLQLTREPAYTRGFFSARSVTGFLHDVYPAAADEVGKIHLLADEKIQGAVFDIPEEIAKELLNKELPRGTFCQRLSSCLPCKMMVLQVTIMVISPIANEDLEVVSKALRDLETWVQGIILVMMNFDVEDAAIELAMVGPSIPGEFMMIGNKAAGKLAIAGRSLLRNVPMMIGYYVTWSPADHLLEVGRGDSVVFASNVVKLGTGHWIAPTMKTIRHASKHPIPEVL
ncbi:hypothetical protein HPP92_015292 [Vanilla planifolia]|uniref:RNA helicase n=1 Tax=Vanilla planifolia TaxID=51239 RepID=A0A835QHK7_VANPL|nr:hypothetical protein HPP92_015292 [Vanilla planifolia]